MEPIQLAAILATAVLLASIVSVETGISVALITHHVLPPDPAEILVGES